MNETEIIEAELEEGYAEVKKVTKSGGCPPTTSEFSDVSDMTKHMQEQTTKLVGENSLPEKDIIGQVSTTEMVIDLALATLARQSSVKLIKLEEFLGKVEDRLFKDETLDELTKSDLMNLYTSTRMMKTDAFRMLKEIRKESDFNNLEATLLSMHSKEDLNTINADGTKMQGLLESLIMNGDFLAQAQTQQKKNLGVENGD